MTAGSAEQVGQLAGNFVQYEAHDEATVGVVAPEPPAPLLPPVPVVLEVPPPQAEIDIAMPNKPIAQKFVFIIRALSL